MVLGLEPAACVVAEKLEHDRADAEQVAAAERALGRKAAFVDERAVRRAFIANGEARPMRAQRAVATRHTVQIDDHGALGRSAYDRLPGLERVHPPQVGAMNFHEAGRPGSGSKQGARGR